MNRRGFLSAIRGAVAVVPVASVAAQPPLPQVAPIIPPPEPTLVESELERLVATSLHRLLELVEVQPICRPVEYARLGRTARITQLRPFRAWEVNRWDHHPVTLSRQSCRGVRTCPYQGPHPEDVTKAVEELANDIRYDYKKGCRGLVFGELPDVSPYGIRECKIVGVSNASMRGIELYMGGTIDEFIIRFDVLWGWIDMPRTWWPRLGGTALLMV